MQAVDLIKFTIKKRAKRKKRKYLASSISSILKENEKKKTPRTFHPHFITNRRTHKQKKETHLGFAIALDLGHRLFLNLNHDRVGKDSLDAAISVRERVEVGQRGEYVSGEE